MLKTTEKFRPLAAAENHHNRCIKCCAYITALLLIHAVIITILLFTVFKLRGPVIRVEKPTADKLELTNGSNMTLNAVVWVKNPNIFASFKYGNMTTTFFYRGVEIGESRGPAGTAKARRTVRVNVTVDILTDRILAIPDLDKDIESGLVNVSSFTRFGGRIDVFVFEKRVIMKMNCNVSINVTSKAIKHHKCKRRIKL